MLKNIFVRRSLQSTWSNISLESFPCTWLYCTDKLLSISHIRFPISGFSHLESLSYIEFLIWHLVNHLCVLSITIVIRVGYIRAWVPNLELSWVKIQYKRRCFLAYGQGPTKYLPQVMLYYNIIFQWCNMRRFYKGQCRGTIDFTEQNSVVVSHVDKDWKDWIDILWIQPVIIL